MRVIRCHPGDSFSDALGDIDYSAAMASRLDDPDPTPPVIFRTVFEITLATVRTQIQNQGGKTGDAGDLTTGQRDAFREVDRLTAGARRSARQAFPGDDVKLHTEFQVGISDPQDFASQLGRAG